MSRIIQVLQNSLIRIAAFLSVALKSIGNLFKGISGFLGNVFGFSESDSQYYLEKDDSQGVKRSEPKPMLTTDQKTSFEPPANRRRTNNKQMDYYLKMAQEIKKG
ncbi:hypothetical protein RIVM261_029980 [Rivularia sp. IAM M-261]|nr:hypothetical protein CAL7716_010620 [Calothrix sp. PCC 7716]GJD18042.1 hypothetical protein RIVM261_029980 [Rivularia sp. IAM M-261]